MQTESVDVTVSEGFLSELARALDPCPPGWRGQVGVTDVPRVLLMAIRNYLADGYDGCDHSVGICACGIESLIGEIDLSLRGEQTCRACGGDGVLWSREKYDAALAEWRANPETRDWDMDEGYGYYSCPACGGGGVTRINTVDCNS